MGFYYTLRDAYGTKNIFMDKLPIKENYGGAFSLQAAVRPTVSSCSKCKGCNKKLNNFK